MTITQLFAVLVRLAGLIILLWGLRSHIPYLASLKGSMRSLAIDDVASLTVIVMSLVAGLIMVALPVAVARRLLPFSDERELATPWSADDLQLVLVSSIGLWILVQAILDSAYWIAFLGYWNNAQLNSPRSIPLPAEHIGNMVSTAAEIIVGLVLLFRAQSIASLVKRLRGL